MKFRTLLSITIAATLLTYGTAMAATHVSVTKAASAPIAVTGCSNGSATSDGIPRNTTVFNRTDEPLQTFEELWTAYDANGKILNQVAVDFGGGDELAAGDSSDFSSVVPNVAFTDGPAIAKFACVVTSATFDNGSWATGKKWKGTLMSASQARASASSGRGSSNGGGNGGGSRSNGRLHFTVVNAWNDQYDGQTFVHDSLMIQGGDSDTNITPDMFVLGVQLTNGGVQQYTGMTAAAPSYLKYNPMDGQNDPQPEVDANRDLGALGSLTVPAHGTVTITVTFALTIQMANPSANRNVTMP